MPIETKIGLPYLPLITLPVIEWPIALKTLPRLVKSGIVVKSLLWKIPRIVVEISWHEIAARIKSSWTRHDSTHLARHWVSAK